MNCVAPGLWIGDRRVAARIVAAAKAASGSGGSGGGGGDDAGAVDAAQGNEMITAILNVSDRVFYMPKAAGLTFQHVPLNDFGKVVYLQPNTLPFSPPPTSGFCFYVIIQF